MYEGVTYVDVAQYTAVIVHDLLKAPPDMVASREEIIHALQRYCIAAQNRL